MDKLDSRGTYTEYLPAYTIGSDAYSHIQTVCKGYGNTAVVIGGKTALEKARLKLEDAFEQAGIEVTGWLFYGGQATHAHAHRLAADPQAKSANMVFGVGGGRAIDTTKEVAALLDKPLFSVPTLASNCAPVTGIAVFYQENGALDTYFFPPTPPVHCFIDMQIIATSPSNYFWAGIGDALSKGPEIELSSREVELSHSPFMARALAVACDEPLYTYGETAYHDQAQGLASDAVEHVALDIIITTGICSNMTTNVVASQGAYYFNSTVAHAFYNAYTSLGARAEKHLHGEIVSFGVLVLRCFDNQQAELKRSYAFNTRLGLPTTLADIDATEADLDLILEKAQETNEWGRSPYGYTPDRFRQAILDADAYGRAKGAHDEQLAQAVLRQIHEHRAITSSARKL